MNDRPTLDEIRARCALPVTELVNNPREYLRVQTILRDRAELLRLLDECSKERDHYMALSAMNNVEALRSALTRALDLLRIGMDVGLEPREKDEANKLLVLFGYGEAFTKSLHEIIGVDVAKGPDQTVTHLVRAADQPAVVHASDCAVHNEPYKPAGPCNCNLADDAPTVEQLIAISEQQK